MPGGMYSREPASEILSTIPVVHTMPEGRRDVFALAQMVFGGGSNPRGRMVRRSRHRAEKPKPAEAGWTGSEKHSNRHSERQRRIS